MKRTHLPVRFLIFIVFQTVISLLLVSCAWFQGEITDEEVKELDEGMSATKRETGLEGSLIKFGWLLQGYDIPRTPIQCKNIGNESAERGMPSDVYTLVSTSINKIGRQIIFIPYDAQYVVSESTTGGNINRLYPKVVIAGGITGYDKDMIQKEREGDASGGWAGASGSAKYSASGAVSRITLDLNMLDYTTQAYFPGVLSTNAVLLRKGKLGWGVSGYYMGCGASMESQVKTKQGVHAALRILVEFSIIEVLGKYFEVPYWRCLKDGVRDENMIARMKDNFSAMTPDVQNLILKKFLYLHGYQGINLKTSKLDSSEQQELRSAMRTYAAKESTDAFIKLWENVPVDQSRKQVVKARRQQKYEAKLEERKAKKAAEEKAKEDAEKRQKQLEEHQAKIASFHKSVGQGDKYLAAGDYLRAKTAYMNAHKLFGGEEYPVKRLNEINTILAEREELEKNYKAQIKLGDQQFKAKKYIEARDAYNQALKLKPGEAYPQEMLEKTEKFLKKKNPLGINKLNDSDWDDDGF
jgi:tetratricopeptide (TPR) repeat protein